MLTGQVPYSPLEPLCMVDNPYASVMRVDYATHTYKARIEYGCGSMVAPGCVNCHSETGVLTFVKSPVCTAFMENVSSPSSLAAPRWPSCGSKGGGGGKEQWRLVEGSKVHQALFRIGNGEPPALPDSLSRNARDLIQRCLQVNPNDRPTAADLLEHPFVQRALHIPLGSESPIMPGR
ncbi:hypothetical protein Cgig2_015586 [Carnegiea gigantea]|uniref:Protein kinase domain-containing protein n=1 Tax=Carnegiea gigantea TaxID=171969 RepID=A0A9Q1GLI7_9CARY|nr:hypothetical protein Cgig2_015586 [Carnegiea gigantea]